MDKEKEIEKMAKMQNSCWRISCEKCIEAQRECDEYRRAELLVNQGYGDVREGVKEFVENIIQKQFSAKLGIGWSAVIKVNDIEQIAKEYGIELFGNTEQMEDKE